MRDWFEDYLDASNRHDLDRIREFVAADVRRAHRPGGVEAWIADLAELFRAFPNWRWRRIQLVNAKQIARRRERRERDTEYRERERQRQIRERETKRAHAKRRRNAPDKYAAQLTSNRESERINRLLAELGLSADRRRRRIGADIMCIIGYWPPHVEWPGWTSART